LPPIQLVLEVRGKGKISSFYLRMELRLVQCNCNFISGPTQLISNKIDAVSNENCIYPITVTNNHLMGLKYKINKVGEFHPLEPVDRYI
jgi:hypothetical protein